MPCAKITDAIAWNKQSKPGEEFPVIGYLTHHFGFPDTKTDDAQKDSVDYGSGKVKAVDAPTPHLKGTLIASRNTDQDGQIVMDPKEKLTYDVEIFPDGTLSYLLKLHGNAVGGMPATKVQATCVNNVLLSATSGSEVVTVGVALKPTPEVIITFKQVANFSNYRLAPDSDDSHGAGNGMFIMYKITQIQNTAFDQSFVFDVNKISTKTKDKTSNDTVTDANILLLGENLTTVTVGAGQTVKVNRCFIKNAQTSDPQSLVSAQVPLIYTTDPKTDPNLPVTLTNLDPNGSVAVVGNALPNPLQSLCSGS